MDLGKQQAKKYARKQGGISDLTSGEAKGKDDCLTITNRSTYDGQKREFLLLSHLRLAKYRALISSLNPAKRGRNI